MRFTPAKCEKLEKTAERAASYACILDRECENHPPATPELTLSCRKHHHFVRMGLRVNVITASGTKILIPPHFYQNDTYYTLYNT